MMYQLDKDEIKNNLTIEQVMNLVSELGGNPRLDRYGDFFVAQTICHNVPGEGSYKLYYYDNTKLFHCYSGCGDSFDIFDLVKRSKNTIGEKIPNSQGEYREWELYHAVKFVANFFNFTIAKDYYKKHIRLQDWDIFNKYEQITSHEKENKKEIILKEYDKKVIENMPLPLIKSWYDEGISYETMVHFGIKYNPVHHSIIIPHYDINNRLVGIRERTLIKENERYGKYRPAYINGVIYNHPLSFNLYNINNSKDNIKAVKKAIVYEGEKSPMLFSSMFGKDNDISVACCGSNLISTQVEILKSLGVEEIIIAFDRQYEKFDSEERVKWTDKLEALHKKYGATIKISFIFDNKDLLPYKASPIDCGKEIFLELFKNRIIL